MYIFLDKSKEGRILMLAFERRERILNELYKNKKVYVNKLASIFNVTEETIRRDLEKMEKEGILTRSYGGASLNTQTNEDLPYQTRNTINIDEKQKMAQIITKIVNDGNTIMADAGSTVLEALKELNHSKENLTVITNSVIALQEFGQSQLSIISTGGNLRKKSSSLVGSITKQSIKRYNVDVAIFSCKGISMEHGITDSNEPESDVKNSMCQQANKIILLVDHTKFDKVAFVELFELEKIDYLITDKEPSEEWLRFLKEHDVEVIYED